MEEYYNELGIQDEQDALKGEEPKYKKIVKKVAAGAKQTEVKETGPSKKSILMEQVIKKAKDEPTFSSVSRIIKIVKQIFNTP